MAEKKKRGSQTNLSSTYIHQENTTGDNIVVSGKNRVISGNSGDSDTTHTHTVITSRIDSPNVNMGSQTFHGNTTITYQSNQGGKNIVVTDNVTPEVPDNGARNLLWDKKREIDAYIPTIVVAADDVDTKYHVETFGDDMILLHKAATDVERSQFLIRRMLAVESRAAQINDSTLRELVRQYLVIVNTVMYY